MCLLCTFALLSEEALSEKDGCFDDFVLGGLELCGECVLNWSFGGAFLGIDSRFEVSVFGGNKFFERLLIPFVSGYSFKDVFLEEAFFFNISNPVGLEF